MMSDQITFLKLGKAFSERASDIDKLKDVSGADNKTLERRATMMHDFARVLYRAAHIANSEV